MESTIQVLNTYKLQTVIHTAGNYIVGVDIPSLTNAQAQILCNDFSGQIQQYAYNNGTPVEPPCNIPVNDNLLNSVLYFSF